MAEINSTSKAGKTKAGAQRSKKHSTRVDLTPMVDLGFLLITFFIFTTAMTQPTGMGLVLPADGPPSKVPESKTLNVVLASNNRVFYYVGNDVGKRSCTDFSPAGIRKVIYDIQTAIGQKYGVKEQLVVLIRPTQEACYKNIVDILDEMTILNVKKYALMEDSREQGHPSTVSWRPC